MNDRELEFLLKRINILEDIIYKFYISKTTKDQFKELFEKYIKKYNVKRFKF